MFEAVTFTPAEAEQITGVTGAVQRDWRRHGYLPSTKGHARFELHDLAELWLLKMFTDRGIGPQRAKVVSASLAHRIAYLTAQVNKGINVDQNKVKLAETAMKLRTQKELSMMGLKTDLHKHHTPQVAAPATEPAGRAQPGQAFQA